MDKFDHQNYLIRKKLQNQMNLENLIKDCSVCCIDFPEAGKKVLCSCGYLACDKCVKRYMMSKTSFPHCMNCKGTFPLSLLNKTYGSVFMKGKFRVYRKNSLFESEKVRFPESMNAATDRKKKLDFEMQTKPLFQELKTLKKDIADARKNIKQTSAVYL